MKINKHNLEIAKHCAKESIRGFATNVLHFTKTGTFAACRCFAIWVTALKVEPNDVLNSMPARDALACVQNDDPFDIVTYFLGPNVVGEFPDLSRYEGKPVAFTINMDAEYLLALAQAAVDFGGGVVRIEFTAPDAPARWHTSNASGQKWEALLMPFQPCPRCGCETRSGICQAGCVAP